MRAKLAAGDVTVHTELLASLPALAQDLSKCAVSLAAPERLVLVLLELPGQRQLGSWTLPQPLSNDSTTWQWCDSRVVAVPWGRSWAWPQAIIGEENEEEATADPGIAGVPWLDTASGDIADIDLGFHEAEEPDLGPFTPCGLLPVRHCKDGVLVWSLFGASGHALHTVPCPQVGWQGRVLSAEAGAGSRMRLGDVCKAFAQVGGRMLLSFSLYTRVDQFFIWHWLRPALCTALMPRPDTSLISRHWSPDSTLLLCVLEDGECIFYSCEGALLHSQRGTTGVQASAWADSGPVALVYRTCLELWTLQDGPGLVRTHHIVTAPSMTLALGYCQPVFSPAGSCVACLAEVGERTRGDLVVTLFSAGDGALLSVQGLTCPAAHLGMEADWCCWAIDGARLGVTYFSGGAEPGLLHLLTVR